MIIAHLITFNVDKNEIFFALPEFHFPGANQVVLSCFARPLSKAIKVFIAFIITCNHFLLLCMVPLLGF